MKAKVYVTLKPSVLDPQGKAIHHSVASLGYKGISEIRQGKYFELEVDDAIPLGVAQSSIERIANDVLANPVIEDFRVEVLP